MTATLTGHICHYCDKPATLICRESGDLYCATDARTNYDTPSDWVTKLTPGTLRKYGK